jgi:phosphate transport system permease protein
LPRDQELKRNISGRRTRGTVYRILLLSSVVIALLALGALIYDIVDQAYGLTAWEYRVDPDTLADRPLNELDKDELLVVLQEGISQGRYEQLNRETPFEDRSAEEIRRLILDLVARQRVAQSWPLFESLFNRAEIEAIVQEEHPDADLRWTSWITWDFLNSPGSSTPELAGIRTAILGSLWMIGITILVAFPLGVGAAIYLEEYADKRHRLSRIIQTNINNLAGVPSIIYGLLGLTIFVRALGGITQGRTVLSAALMILPLIIINAQEAIRAVPDSLRQASYGVGATKWQTIWHHVLPVAFPGILTGNILAMSRAIGETAPLIVVGASTFITFDPDGPFSRFTALPILIYNWTARPQQEYKIIAAAAIIVLLILLLSLNSVAIILRNRLRKAL